MIVIFLPIIILLVFLLICLGDGWILLVAAVSAFIIGMFLSNRS